jgi:DNA-binding MarR family transcriptional regulator
LGVNVQIRLVPRREVVLYEGIRLVRPLHRHVYRLVEQSLAAEGVTVAMRAVLERLHERGAAPVPAVARDLALPRQVVQRLADALAERGLVARAPNPAHRRSTLQRLTPTGAALIARVLAREAEQLRTLAAPLSAADIATFHDVMAYLTAEIARRAPLDPEARGPEGHDA